MRPVKSLISFALFFSLMLGACENYNYLPSQKDFKTSSLGSYLVLYYQSPLSSTGLDETEGELIAISSDSVFVLNKGSFCEAIARDSVSGFDLQYAKPKRSYWTTAGFLAWSLTHGQLAVGTAFLNLIAVNLIHENIVRNSFSDEQDLTLDELSLFARFPKGLPDGVNKKDIK